jgi:hypothetical protein
MDQKEINAVVVVETMVTQIIVELTKIQEDILSKSRAITKEPLQSAICLLNEENEKDMLTANVDGNIYSTRQLTRAAAIELLLALDEERNYELKDKTS